MNRWILGAALAVSLTPIACGGGEEEPVKYEANDIADGTGPAIAAGGPTEVWAATNKWADINTPTAQLAGPAWGENSGLNWEQKFDIWIESLERTEVNGWPTFIVTTPWGDKAMRAPRLECAEVAIVLRATFASWYNLPFFISGWDSEAKQSVYAGHFGFVYRDGSKAGKFPNFRDSYSDYTSSWEPGMEWPMDLNLRSKRLGEDDANDFLENPDGSPAGAGAYFDELYLNKRTGHFMRLLLLYFGSVNLADGSNMFHVQADATSAGDVLLHRRKKVGTGHAMPVMRVGRQIEGKIAPEVAWGNMPRAYPKWEDTLTARHRFLDDAGGGHGTNFKDEEYRKLGGGIRRWRSAVWSGGRWKNRTLEQDEAVAIESNDYEAIEARVDRFDEIIITGSPEETETVILANIESAREHLRKFPASCSARINRETAFEALYAHKAQHGGLDTAAVDAAFRTEEDRVFGELVYESSKTCCWNSTTSAMYDIIMDYRAAERANAEAQGMCLEPTVFKARPGGDGYDMYRAHAEAMGLGHEWVAWSEDEACPPANVEEDLEAETMATPMCI